MKRNVLEYLEESALNRPDKIAFEDEACACSFLELKENARAVGTCLSSCVSNGKPIPVLMEKSVQTMTAFMGAVYAGCFYVLIDPKFPVERMSQILRTLGAEVLVTDYAYDNVLESLSFEGKVVYIQEAVSVQAKEELLLSNRRQHLDISPLYANFTSGSTGIPKGVVVSHRSVIDFIEEFTRLFDITHEDVIGNQAPFDFDVSVKDIYTTLKTGATMQIIPKKLFSFPTKLLDFIVEREVTTLIWAVSALCIITTLKGFDYKVPIKVKKIIFSGEVMPMKHLNEWRKHLPHAMYVNVYGPTEITCNCTYYIVDRAYEPGEVLPIGIPFPNEKVFLLNEQDHEVTKPNTEGEICVSGTALSLGYYNNKEQTEKAFVQNPLNTCYIEPIYRTGDLAFYNEDGLLCFTSRKDFQIKHMGHRIELGEIEAAMEAVEGINRICCIYSEQKNKVVAFYEGEVEKRQIVRTLGGKLPAFMIPNVFEKMEKLPISKNGKIDRQELKSRFEGFGEA